VTRNPKPIEVCKQEFDS
jgi:hypothetical protein